MAIEISCSNCGKTFRVRDEAAGKSFDCKSCGTTIRIPNQDDAFLEEEDELPPPRRPFREDDDDARPTPRRTAAAAAGNTLAPAIGLYVTAGAWLLFTVMYGMLQLLNPPPKPAAQPGVNQAAHDFGYQLGYYGPLIGWPLICMIILVGAYYLQTRRNYALALMGCIVASIPCCSPALIFGIPFGIWGIVVLLNHDVKRSFE